MKKSKKKIFIIVLLLVTTIIVSPLAYIEYRLITDEYKCTKATDIGSVFKVNYGSDFEVLRTKHNKNNNHDELIVMVQYDHVFKEYLVIEIGCTEYDRMGAAGFYETKDGKKFSMIMGDRLSYAIIHLPYAIEIIDGVTMEDIIGDNNKS